MSDKPKPGKDKDSRSLRQAIEATQVLFEALAGETANLHADYYALQLAEAMLFAADQLDQLDSLLENVDCLPISVLEQNRQLRAIVRVLLHPDCPVQGVVVAQMAEAVGRQLKALLVVKEIRATY
jgi:hypothetical protein